MACSSASFRSGELPERSGMSGFRSRLLIWEVVHSFLMDDSISLRLPTYTFEFFDKSSDFLKNALLLCEVLRIERAHLGQNGIELSAIFTGKLPLQRGDDIALGRLRIQALVV